MNISTKFLNGTRFLLALWVALDHFYVAIGGVNFIKIPKLSVLLTSGAQAVDGFMIITGFLMMYNYYLREGQEPPDNKFTFVRFWVRRLFRLYPVYVIAIISAFLLQNIMTVYGFEILHYFTGASINAWGYSVSTPNLHANLLTYSTLADLLTHLTFSHGLIPNYVGGILGPAWSLSLEMQFYLVFPFLFLVLFKTETILKKRLVIALSISQLVAYITPKLFGQYTTPGLFLHYGQPSLLIYKMPLFLFGMILAGVATRRINLYYLMFCLLLIITSQGPLTNIIIVFLTILTLLDQLSVSLHPKLFRLLNSAREVLSSKLAKTGADISYSLYLFHYIMLPLTLHYCIQVGSYFSLGKFTTLFLSLVTFLCTTIFVSYCLHIFIEKRFILIGKDITKQIGSTGFEHTDTSNKFAS